ncbi:MAG: hypothetical protein SOR91_09155 [Hornefia butyriciproducens]|uniref:hypothetical protein n=1 Tax=Hornefia butyriciproducens TaxID=2652293 RepID=UPI002A75DDAD|nr:hypothetical protein [Hornefia butyriciproducens]MDY2991622.1 hypothetical protein [Hornefia butyriciproducens]
MANTDDAKRFLRQYREARAAVRHIDMELSQMHDELMGRGTAFVGVPRTDASGKTVLEEQVMDRVQSGRTGDPVGNLAARIADATEEAMVRRTLALDAMREVSGIIRAVEDPRLRDVLHRRYIQCQRWEEIAAEMQYSYRQTLRFHGDGLLEVGQFLEKNPKKFRNVLKCHRMSH